MMTEAQLIADLSQRYLSAKKGEVSTAVHLFGIDRANELEGANINLICEAAGLTSTWGTEVRKGIRLARYVQRKP